jgi:drug/metabolite transporter (DMT)-like permease
MTPAFMKPVFPWAVLSLLAGATLWGVSWYPFRLLESQGLNGIWLSLILYASAFLGSFPRWPRFFSESIRNPRLMGILLASGGWTNIAFVLSILKGNILRVLLLFYLSPLWATLLGWIFLKEQPTRQSLLALALVLCGAMSMLLDPATGFPWPQDGADWLAISAGFGFAVSNVTVRRAAHISIATKSIMVFFGVAVLAGLWILAAGDAIPRAPLQAFSGGILLGIIGILGMTVLVQYGVTHLPVHRSSVILLFELVAAVVSQQLLTDERVTALEWVGGALIVLGAYLAATPPAGVSDGREVDQKALDRSRE